MKKTKPDKLIKSINHIKLDLGNARKLNQLDELGDAYMTLMQSYMVKNTILSDSNRKVRSKVPHLREAHLVL